MTAVSIVILNYNTASLLRACLHSIRQYASGTEVIVVDNASPDHSASLVQQRFPEVHFIATPENLGFARGMNLGIKSAGAPLVITLNADTELLPSTLPTLLRALDQLPQAGIIGPAQYLPHPHVSGQGGAPRASAFRDPTLWNETQRLLFFTDSFAARLKRGPWQAPSGPPRQVDWLMAAALLFRRECLDAINGFDETEFMYGEDWDICYRARRAGWQVYLVPEAPILHHENASGKYFFGAARKARVLQANLHFHEKHFGRTSRRVLAGINSVGALMRLVLLLPTHFTSPLGWEYWQAQWAEARVALHALN